MKFRGYDGYVSVSMVTDILEIIMWLTLKTMLVVNTILKVSKNSSGFPELSCGHFVDCDNLNI